MPRSHRRRWLGATLIVTVGSSILLAGSVRSWQMLIVQLGAAAVLASVLRMPDAALEKADPLRRLLLAGGVLVAVCLVGLIPVPGALTRLTSPGIAQAFPDSSWTFLSLQPEATVGAVFTGLLAMAVVAGSAVWSAARGGRSGAALVVVGLLASLTSIALLHVATATTQLFGVIPLDQPPDRYFAPLVNPNHTAILLLLLLPVCVEQALLFRDGLLGLIAGATALTALGVLISIGSGGAMLALIVVVVVGVALNTRSVVATGGALVALIASVTGAGWAWVTYVEPSWFKSSFALRAAQYSDFPSVFGQHWLTGSGAGTYASAYAPLRSTLNYRMYRHAHSEPQEWLVETGLLGLAAVVAAVFLLPRLSSRTAHRARWWGLGLLGVAVYACIDFPLHVPGVLLSVMLVFGVWRGGFGAQKSVNVATLRRALTALLIVQVMGAAWWARAALVEHEVNRVLAVADDPDAARIAADRMAWLAPWRSEPTLARGWLGDEDDRVAAGRAVVQAHPDDATALRRAASLLIAGGETEQAQHALERAITRDVGDYRTFVVYSRLLREQDPEVSAAAWADAIVRWPWRRGVYGAPLVEGYEAYPIGLYWVDAIHEAEAPWHAALGQLLTSRRDHASAVLAYERAGVQDPGYRWVPERALSLDALGKSDQAERFLELAAPYNRASLTFYTTYATLYTRWGQPEQAIATYLAGQAALPEQSELGGYAVQAAADISAERAVQTAEQLSEAGRLSADAALFAGSQALSIGRHRLCVEFLDTSNAVELGDSEAVRTLWSQCAAGCEDCAATPD